jgi:hypothetical protein
VTTNRCTFEDDVLQVVTIGQWPRRASDELVRHAGLCPSCSEVVFVTSSLLQLDDDSSVAPPPDGRLVWQRAQLRVRLEAVERATRPIATLELATALGLILLATAAAVWLPGVWSDALARGLGFGQEVLTTTEGATAWAARVMHSSMSETEAATWRLLASGAGTATAAVLLTLGLVRLLDSH